VISLEAVAYSHIVTRWSGSGGIEADLGSISFGLQKPSPK